MAGVREIFEMVERALDGGVPEGAAMEQVAIQYAEVARKTRKRLSSALELARNGLRMELRAAVQERPSLIETADCFTSELAIKWREYCKQQGLQVPSKVSTAAIEELQLALAAAEDLGLDQLHRLFRRQNLGLASVYDRLQTLRRIASRDRENPIWSDDVPEFEAEAISELRRRFADAIKSASLDDATEVVECLSQDGWVSTAARKLGARSQGELAQVVAKQARERSVVCARELYASYMAESVERVSAQLTEWNSLCDQMSAGGVRPPSGSVLVVGPIIQWLEARHLDASVQQETRSRLEGLERAAVDTKASADEIQARLVAAEQMPGGVPEDLRAMAERRVHEHASGQRVRRTVKFLVAGGVVVAVLTTAVWFVMGALRTADEERFAEAVAAAVGRSDAGEVARLLESSRQAANGYDQLPGVLVSLETLATNQRLVAERDAQFEEQLAAAGDPTSTDGDPSALAAAAELARTDEQRDRVAQWRQSQQATSARSQQATDAAFLEQTKDLARQIDGVVGLPPEAPATEALVKRAEILAARIGGATGIGRDARIAFDAQRRRLAAVRDALDRHSTETMQASAHRSALSDVIDATGDPAKLPAALELFADTHPDSPYSREFRDALAQAGDWTPVLQWLKLASRIGRDPFPSAESDRAARRADLEKFVKENPKSALSDQIAAYQGLLAEGRNWTQWLSNLVRTWPPMRMGMIELVNGERYYLLEGEVPKATTTDGVDVVNVVTNWTDEKIGPVRIERKRIKRIGPSPQQKLGEALGPLIRGVSAKPTGEGAIEALLMIRDDSDVDPVARAYLISGLLPQIQSALPTLSSQIDRSIALLTEEDLEGIDWLAPRIPSTRPDFKIIAGLLSTAVPVAQWQRDYRSEMSATRAWLASSLRCVGILDKTEPPFTVRWSEAAHPKAGERLFAVAVVDRKSTIVEIGVVALSGSMQLANVVRDLPTGTPIFAGSYETATSADGGSK
ncbi:MAG: hypothetical protein EXS03_09340 [Phycisphaerales bacterium]|nr:hypothetical protein [Phycisphaerales bacterium]